MELEDMGLVYQYLLKHRTIEYKPQGRRSSDGEPEVANVLRASSLDDFDRFQRFLRPQGLKIVEFDDHMRGISAAGRAWILARDNETVPAAIFSTDRLYREMRIRDGESREALAVWFLHIWLIYLSLIYTRPGRGISEVSGYLDATFSREVLTEAVEEHVEHVRNTCPGESAEGRIVSILTTEKGQDINRRVLAFLHLMKDAGLVQEVSTGEYQQTLLGAYEISEHYDRTLRSPVDHILQGIVNITAPQTVLDQEEEEMNGTD